MDIKRLEIFGAAAHEESFTKAAEKLFTSQPAVSMQIKLLEQEIGLRLFERAGKKIRLTHEGKLLYVSAQKIQQNMKEAEEIVSDLKGLKTGYVHIGASSTPGVYLLPEVIGEFKKKHTQIQVKLTISNTETILKCIARGDVHIGFIGWDAGRTDMDVESFITDQIIPVFAPSHPLLKKRNLSIKKLAEEPFILREQGSGTRALLERELARKNVQLQNIVMEIGNTEGIKRAVSAGLGISFLSYFSVTEELKIGKLRTLHLQDFKLRRKLNRVLLQNTWLSPSVKLFLDFCNDCKETLKSAHGKQPLYAAR